jgi:hypothetical protein
MKTSAKGLVAVLIPAVALAFGDKDDERKFEPGAASSYATRQTNQKVTVAAVPFTTDDQTRAAFGKHNPYQYGILPVLVVIQNDKDEPVRMSALQAEFMLADGRHIEAIPPRDVPNTLAHGPKDGTSLPGNGPRLPFPTPKKKNPLLGANLEGRAFVAPMLLPHESAYGFFYFQTRLFPGAKLYLSGLQAARSGEGVVFFEVPLEEK